jgi:hypothetical protein
MESDGPKRPACGGGIVRIRSFVVASLGFALASACYAQSQPAASSAPAQSATIKVGATIFTDFTYQEAPEVLDADKNLVHKSEFEVRRAYINLVGSFSDLIVVRVTPDVASRLATSLTGASVAPDVKAATSLDGSLVLRLKYAYGQLNLDRLGAAAKGAWIRLGQQQTPYIDMMEGIYRYRFQGTIFVERQGLLSSSDVGLAGRFGLPAGYGEIHLGYYNGDTYSRPEVNDQKALQLRASLRPFPQQSMLKGLRLHGFYDHDSPVVGGARERLVASATFEQRYANLGFEYVSAEDRASGLAAAPTTHARGFTVWLTPRTSFGLEGLLRYDHYEPNHATGATKRETIVGLAYWLPATRAPLTAALLVDYDGVDYDAALGRPDEKRWELKALLSF